MAIEYRLSHTAAEIDENLTKVSEIDYALKNKDSIPTENSENLITSGGVYTAINEAIENVDVDLTDYATKEYVNESISSISSGGGIETVSWNDLEDKPFEDTRILSRYSYDENPNPASFDCVAMNYSFYKVSDFVLTKEEIFNTKITVRGNYELPKFSQSNVLIETDNIIIAQDLSDANGFAFCFCNTTGVCNFSYSGYSLSVNVPETGIYRINGLGFGMSDCKIVDILVSGELKQIDPKFIPANLDFDLSDYYTKVEMDALIGDCEAVLNEINALVGE